MTKDYKKKSKIQSISKKAKRNKKSRKQKDPCMIIKLKNLTHIKRKLFKLFNFTIIIQKKKKTLIKKGASKLLTLKEEKRSNKIKQIKCSKKLISISIKFNCSKKIFLKTHPKN